MPYSHHSHSGQFCRHATGLLEDVVLEAIHQGFEIYGLTEHVPRYRAEDLYPEEIWTKQGLTIETLTKQFEDFLVEAHRLKTVYASRIKLLVGLETEFITPVDLDSLQALLEKHGDSIEYVVGSLHHVNGIPIDFDLPTFQKALDKFNNPEMLASSGSDSMENFLSSYFDAHLELLKLIRPEVIGHIDLCRLYDHTLKLREFPSAWERLVRNVRFAVEYGALFEVNAAAFKKGWPTAYPAEDVLELIIEEGGRFALSDDSHGPHAVGLNYDRLVTYLRHMGVDKLWTLDKSANPNAAGRKSLAVPVDGDWWEHPFWVSRSLPK